MIGSGRWSMLPPVVKNLLIINGLMFLAAISFDTSIGIDLWDILGLHYPGSEKFEVYQIVSYMFMHGSFTHIFFNMFAVWIFGNAIENTWGSKRFLIYYVLTGFGAAFLHYLIYYIEVAPTLNAIEAIIVSPQAEQILSFASSHEWKIYTQQYPEIAKEFFSFRNGPLQVLSASPDDQEALRQSRFFFEQYLEYFKNLPNVVGASGSLFGILIAFGMMFPNVRLMLLFPPIPIKAKWLVTAYGAMELYSAFQGNPNSNVAHFAHLGGMLFGFLIIKFWQKSGVRWR